MLVMHDMIYRLIAQWSIVMNNMTRKVAFIFILFFFKFHCANACITFNNFYLKLVHLDKYVYFCRWLCKCRHKSSMQHECITYCIIMIPWSRCCECSFWLKYSLFVINFIIWVGNLLLYIILRFTFMILLKPL